MNWYAIHTKPRQEAVAEASLRLEGLELFCPLLRRKKIIRRVSRWQVRPLFSCYLFARFNFEVAHRMVRYANGVTNIVSFGGKPAIVDDAIIEAIRSYATENVVTIPPPQFKQGDLVKIQDGPLRGVEAIFEKDLNDTERVVVLLEIIAKRAHVEVLRDQLVKV